MYEDTLLRLRKRHAIKICLGWNCFSADSTCDRRGINFYFSSCNICSVLINWSQTARNWCQKSTLIMVLPVSTMSSTMTMLAPYNFLMSWIPWMPTEPEGRVSIFMKSNATWIEVWDRVELNLFTLSGSKKVYHLKTSFSGRLKKQLTKELKVSPGQVSLGRTCILLWRLEKADSEDLWQPGPKMNKGWGNWIHCDKLLLVLVRCKGSEPVQKSWFFFYRWSDQKNLLSVSLVEPVQMAWKRLVGLYI